MHVIEQMAVKRPVPRLVSSEIECRAAAGLDDHRVLLRLVHAISAVDQFEKMAVQMDGVGSSFTPWTSRSN